MLEDLAKEHEIVRLILQRRELQKLSSTFVENLIGFAVEDGSGIQQFSIWDHSVQHQCHLRPVQASLQLEPLGYCNWQTFIRQPQHAKFAFKISSWDLYSKRDLWCG